MHNCVVKYMTKNIYRRRSIYNYYNTTVHTTYGRHRIIIIHNEKMSTTRTLWGMRYLEVILEAALVVMDRPEFRSEY